MSSLTELKKLARFMRGGNSMRNANNSNCSSISNSVQEQPHSLDKMLKCIKQQTNSRSQSNSNNSQAQSGQVNNTNQVNSKLVHIHELTHQRALKIVNVIRYLSSPLRLALKIKYIADPASMSVDAFKFDDPYIAQDIKSPWSTDDYFGLRVLVKIVSFNKMLEWLGIPDIDRFSEYFQKRRNVTTMNLNEQLAYKLAYYLFNVVFAENTPTVVTEILNRHLQRVSQDEIAVEFLSDITDDLKAKIAQEMNMYGYVVFRKRATLRDHYRNEQTFTPDTLITMITQTLEAKGMGEQLGRWLNEDVQAFAAMKSSIGGKRSVKKSGNRK